MNRIIFALFASAAALTVGCNKISGPQIKPISDKTIIVTKSGGNFSFFYSIENPVDDATIQTECVSDWIYDIDDSNMGVVAFSVKANEDPQPRQGTITLTYKCPGSTSVSMEITVSQNESSIDVDFNAPLLYGQYLKLKDVEEVSNYWTFMSDKGLGGDFEYTLADGTYFRLDIFGEVASDLKNITIPEGTYTLSAENEKPGTFYAGLSQYFTTDSEGKINYSVKYTSGTVTVKNVTEGSEITLEAVTADGQKVRAYFKGKTSFKDYSEYQQTKPNEF